MVKTQELKSVTVLNNPDGSSLMNTSLLTHSCCAAALNIRDSWKFTLVIMCQWKQENFRLYLSSVTSQNDPFFSLLALQSLNFKATSKCEPRLNPGLDSEIMSQLFF